MANKISPEMLREKQHKSPKCGPLASGGTEFSRFSFGDIVAQSKNTSADFPIHCTETARVKEGHRERSASMPDRRKANRFLDLFLR